MKKAIIVHCWGGTPTDNWYKNTKRELEENGFTVTIPAFPDTDAPNLSKWLPVLQDSVKIPDEDTYLIGHSVGCITILRYLESLEEGQKVGGVVLVAGFTDDLNGVREIADELSNFFETPLDWGKIKLGAGKFTAIHSDNDPFVDLRYAKEFEEKLDAKVIIKNAMNHFSGPIKNEPACIELTDVAESIREMI